MKSLIILLLVSFSSFAYGEQIKLGSIPVQDAGRIKPFDTFARESLALVYGREAYKPVNAADNRSKISAVDVVFSWLIVPEAWNETQIVLIRHSGLREALKLDNERLYYSPDEILRNERLSILIQDLNTRRDAEEKLDPFYQAVQTLESQVSLFSATAAGISIKLLPDNGSSAWLSVSKLPEEFQQPFAGIVKAFSDYAKTKGENEKPLNTAVGAFIAKAKQVYGNDYAPFRRVTTEIHYNQFHPFMWSWIFYLLSALVFAAVVFWGKESWTLAGWALMVIAFLLHTYGFGLRVFISERAPVTNMYETVVWVAWGGVVLSVILERVFRMKVLLFGAAIVATLSLILCDLSSHVLDEAIHPLEPVLRDNFWLLTHVLTITLSYAAFFVAFIIGDIVLFQFLKDEQKFQKSISTSVNAIYRLIQVGVVLLAAGTILGGIWADYSWGRFWGWDPKETWAFIALMGYLAILHARLVGLIRNFGIAAVSVLAFSLVIMAWYGVNFVLGAGLHTYGFGAGGVEYVSGFVALHILYVAFVATVRHTRAKSS